MNTGKACRCYLARVFCVSEDSPIANDTMFVYTDPHPLTGKKIKGRKNCPHCKGKGYISE